MLKGIKTCVSPQLPMSQNQTSANFMEVVAWKVLLGILKLNLSYNPDTDKFCLALDNTRKYIRIDADLVIVNATNKALSQLDKSKTMAVRIDDGCDPADLDAVCLVHTKPSALVVCDSI